MNDFNVLKTEIISDLLLPSQVNHLLKECSKRHFKEIKYFSPTEQKIPTGIAFARGGFIHECKKNGEAFTPVKEVYADQDCKKRYQGGVIVFPADATVAKLDTNALNRDIKQILHTFNQRINKFEILHKIKNKFNNCNKEHISAYCVGNFFHGKYIGNNGEIYDKQSLTLEVNGLSTKGLLYLAETVARIFKQKCSVVKDLNTSKIYIANELRNSIEPNFYDINLKWNLTND